MSRTFKADSQIVEESAIPEGGVIAGDGVTWERQDRRDPTDVPVFEQEQLTTSDGRNVRDLVAAGWKIGFENNEYTTQKAFGYNILQEDEGRGIRVVYKPNKELRTNLDTVMVMIPPGASIAFEREQKERAQAYLAAGEEDGPGFPGQFDKRRLTEDDTHRQSRANRASGMIDPEHGMTLQEGLAKISPQERERMMERYRRGPRHMSMDEEAARVADSYRTEPRGRKSFAMGAGFDANGRLER